MELRTTEQEVNDMLIVYESLRRSDHWSTTTTTTASTTTTEETPPLLQALDKELPEPHPSRAVLLEEDSSATFQTYASEAELLTALEDLRASFPALEARIEKFQQRLADKDPITQAPRYGAKTVERVQNVLVVHRVLKAATWAAFGMELVESPEETAAAAETNSSSIATAAAPTTTTDALEANPNSVVSKLRVTVEAQQEALQQAESQAQQARHEQEANQRAVLQQQRAAEQADRQRIEQARRQDDAQLARRAEHVRQAQRQEQEAVAQAERDWINSIPKGPAGVRQQIQIIQDDTENDPPAQKAALLALLTLFTQIAQHPEEINFRRIRRDHPKFHQDIGRHKGGKEVLLAAGFKLATVDEIPCFFSKEPDLESDMDGWSEWFDGIKANLEVVKQMQQ